MAQLLAGMGAEVRGADPHVVEATAVDELLTRVEVTAEELGAADAVVLLTDHDAFDYDAIVDHSRLVLDCRHRVRGPRVVHL